MSKSIEKLIEEAEYLVIDGLKHKIIRHADGVTFVPMCDFCVDPCNTDWCPTKEDECE